jgi:hypothetical protein
MDPLRSRTTCRELGSAGDVGDDERCLDVEQDSDLVGGLVGDDVDVEQCVDLHGGSFCWELMLQASWSFPSGAASLLLVLRRPLSLGPPTRHC